jgi:hypothetical protein
MSVDMRDRTAPDHGPVVRVPSDLSIHLGVTRTCAASLLIPVEDDPDNDHARTRLTYQKQPPLNARLQDAGKARAAMLDRFRARPSPDDPEVLARQAARAAASEARDRRIRERTAQRLAEREQREADAHARREREAAEAARQAEEATRKQADTQAAQKAARDARYAARKARAS